MRISDWSSDVCSSDLWPKNQNRCWNRIGLPPPCSSCCPIEMTAGMKKLVPTIRSSSIMIAATNSAGKASRPMMDATKMPHTEQRSEEHTSELQSLMRISYAVFCLKKKTKKQRTRQKHNKTNTHTQ